MLIINNAMHANKKSNLQDWEFYLRPGKSKIHIWKFFSFLFEETTPSENLLYYLDSHVTDVLSLQVLSVPLWPCWASLFYHSICVHQIFPWGICDFLQCTVCYSWCKRCNKQYQYGGIAPDPNPHSDICKKMVSFSFWIFMYSRHTYCAISKSIY